jgi:hypothetical protein
VVAAEPGELALPADGGLGRWLCGEPLLLGLLEAFDLALGLRVVGAGVVEPDVEAAELDLEGDPAAAAGEAGEDRPVVGEHAGGDSPAHEGLLEGVDDVGPGDGAPRDAGHGQTGVVVERVEDLHRCAVGEPPAGGVGLPAFVGLFGFEPVPGRPGSLLRLGG